jgi:diazepam-binding inhibitor (GABA receptor modulating acyl-CoA-binding protein)
MDLNIAFNDAVARVALLDDQPGNVQLSLYGLFKQAQFGDASGSRPGVFDMRGRAKYDAWTSHKGLAPTEAKEAYIHYVEDLGA